MIEALHLIVEQDYLLYLFIVNKCRTKTIRHVDMLISENKYKA